MTYLIKCKGRWSVHGKQDCADRFEYIGKYGDKKLVEHQEKEKTQDCRQHWWTGFENDEKFELMKSSKKKTKREESKI